MRDLTSPDLPKLPVKVTKKLKTLTLSLGDNDGVFDITDGEVDLIQIDQWISDVLFAEYEKANLRKRLTGK